MNEEKTILSMLLISLEGDDKKLLSEAATSSMKPKPSSSGTSVLTGSGHLVSVRNSEHDCIKNKENNLIPGWKEKTNLQNLYLYHVLPRAVMQVMLITRHEVLKEKAILLYGKHEL